MRVVLVIVAALLLGACGGPTVAEREKVSATQAVVNERVKAGQMTDAEGKLVMAKLKADMDAERRRNYAIAVGGDAGGAVYQPVGGGTVLRY